MELSILRKSACPRTIVIDHAAIQPSSLPAPIIGLVLFFWQKKILSCLFMFYHLYELSCFIIYMNDKIIQNPSTNPYFFPPIFSPRNFMIKTNPFDAEQVELHQYWFVYPAIFWWSYTVYNIHATYLGFKILHCDLGGARRLSSNIHWRTWSGDELSKHWLLQHSQNLWERVDDPTAATRLALRKHGEQS